MEYLEEIHTLTDKQFGFRSGRSCVMNLVSFYSRAADIIQEREGWADCVYLDLKKPFDKVPHQRLLWKIKKQGNREMRKLMKGEKSEWCRVTSTTGGQPQPL